MVGRRRLVLVAAIAAVALFAGACSSDDSGDGGGDDAKTRVTSVEDGLEAIRVPGDQKTIQAAVDSAEAGDLILVSEGVYKEAVDVTTADITIRGVEPAESSVEAGLPSDVNAILANIDFADSAARQNEVKATWKQKFGR